MKRLILTITFVALIFSFSKAGRRYVTHTGSGDKSGSSWANASDDIQAKIDELDVDEIWVAAGVYKPTHRASDGVISPNHPVNSFVFQYGVRLYGGFAGTETKLEDRNWVANKTYLSGDIGTPNDNSDNCYHVVISAGDVGNSCLDGFVVIRGNARMETEATYELKVNDVIIAGKKGGGIHYIVSTLIINNCIITDNEAVEDGGGIYSRNWLPSVITNSTISNNKADWGGGVYISSAYAGYSVMTNCTISNNEARKGGGLHCDIKSLQITNCVLNKNRATWGEGGGIYTTNSQVTLTNCTMVGNTTDIYANPGSTIKVYNSILFGRVANDPFSGPSSGPITISIKNSIVKDTTDDYVANDYIDEGSNIYGGIYTDAQLFTNIAMGNYTLAAGSPAIDAGSNILYGDSISPDKDLAGNPRLYGDSIDIGAYEWREPSTTGLFSTQSNEGIILYPNPVKAGFVQMVVDQHSFALGDLVQVLDMTGKVVYKTTITGTEMQLIMPQTAGVYIVNITAANGQRANMRIVVE